MPAIGPRSATGIDSQTRNFLIICLGLALLVGVMSAAFLGYKLVVFVQYIIKNKVAWRDVLRSARPENELEAVFTDLPYDSPRKSRLQLEINEPRVPPRVLQLEPRKELTSKQERRHGSFFGLSPDKTPVLAHPCPWLEYVTPIDKNHPSSPNIGDSTVALCVKLVSTPLAAALVPNVWPVMQWADEVVGSHPTPDVFQVTSLQVDTSLITAEHIDIPWVSGDHKFGLIVPEVVPEQPRTPPRASAPMDIGNRMVHPNLANHPKRAWKQPVKGKTSHSAKGKENRGVPARKSSRSPLSGLAYRG